MAHPAQSFGIEARAPDTLAVSGVLLFANAREVLAALSAALPRGRASCLDLAGVSSVDSAGLACVLALMAEADAAGGSMRVHGMPAGLLALAKVSEVDHLLVSAASAA